MRLVVGEKEKVHFNRILEWILYFFGYVLVFFLASKLFKSFQIDQEHPLFYYTLATFIIYLLNKTIKPILVSLTIPITGLTLGLFYPFIILFILKLTDWILLDHFNLKDFWAALFLSILISIMNFFMEELVIRPIMRKVQKHG